MRLYILMTLALVSLGLGIANMSIALTKRGDRGFKGRRGPRGGDGEPGQQGDTPICDCVVNVTGSGSDLIGPVTSTDKAISLWDGTTGDTIQSSSVVIDEDGTVSTTLASFDQWLVAETVITVKRYVTYYTTQNLVFTPEDVLESNFWFQNAGVTNRLITLPASSDLEAALDTTDLTNLVWTMIVVSFEKITISGDSGYTVWGGGSQDGNGFKFERRCTHIRFERTASEMFSVFNLPELMQDS